MSPYVFSECVCLLLFIVLAVKTDSQECGQSTYEISTDPSVKDTGYATEGMWPWMVALRKTFSTGAYFSLCSGFLIDKRHILSSAHCYEKDTESPEQFRARIGHINEDVADEYRITRIVIPQSYRTGYFYSDIAVLTLDREVSFPNFSPICLPDEQVSGMNLTGRSAADAGWKLFSVMEPEHEQKMNLIYRADMQIVSDQDCEEAYRLNLNDSFFEHHFPHGFGKDLFCASFSEAGPSNCVNFGGPLMIKNESKWFAVGIVTFGMGCRSPELPEGFTNVTNFIDWIRENTED